METLTGSAAAQLLAGKPLCGLCLAIGDDPASSDEATACNALTVDEIGRVHPGDAIEGMTLCGLDGNRWTWVIPTSRPAIER